MGLIPPTIASERIPFVPSPHFSSRDGNCIEGIVLHYDRCPNDTGAINWFANPLSRKSAHYCIGREGQITQMCPLNQAAWHAGIAELEVRGVSVHNVNQLTIGIELANIGPLWKHGKDWFWTDSGHAERWHGAEPKEGILDFGSAGKILAWWEPYPVAQIEALAWLLGALITLGGLRDAALHLVGHDEIAVPRGRKWDPGPLFPWERFARKTTRSITSL